MSVPNAIGKFIIGQSAIGTPAPFDFNRALISQYANSPILLKLIEDFAQYIDPTANMDAFYDLIWNVDTAQGVGLDIWGRIVGVTRVITTVGDIDFGFAEAGSVSAVGFGQGEFHSGAETTTNNTLSDDAFRLLVFAKALANITDCSVTSINQLMLNLFPGRGDCHVQDNMDMTLTYVFNFATTPVEKAVIQGSGALPRPTGVFPLYVFV
ncbi:MAG: DUF2612 domain-containing protein [Gallionellaceae bacterium]|jgi:hypothetical protein